ncbi:hypothetical protein BGX29_009567 [Mortierella sp. GBA35]|nr:hypothetical protein BGX23_006426 [Mortierella sp. AD031]KAF9106411.1 hypothetical protein BGX29_009567 [Mortierella sp. GBA35]KAG0210376.1 hypothetical protein BGX33_004945 [Mortierella sp. NVP41]
MADQISSKAASQLPIYNNNMPEQQPSAIRIIQPANGNPGPLGLFAFAVTTIIANLYNIGAGVPAGGGGSILTGFALWYGGIVQILAGMWAMKVGNTFEATAFSSFGAYWAAYGYMFFPGTQMKESYASAGPEAYQNATGIFLFVWALLAIILTVGTTRSTVATVIMFLFLDLHLLFMVGNEFGHYPEEGWPKKVGSVFGILTALMAFYNGAAALWLPSNSHILLPVGPFNNNKQQVHIV